MQYNEGNIAETLLRNGDPQRPAIIQGRDRITYAALRNMTAQIGRTLSTISKPGECIGLIAENSPFCAAAYLGTMRAGRVTVPLPGDISARQLAHIIRNTRMKHTFISGHLRRKHAPLLRKAGVQMREEHNAYTPGPARPMPEINPAEDLAAIMFTSGSTGIPKGVMVTHRNIECNSRDIIHYLGLSPRDRAMVVLPLHYCFGASLLHTHLLAGGSVVLNNHFLYPESVLDDMQQRKCTGLAGVPSTYQILLRRSTFRQRNLPELQWFQQAGGKLPDPFIREIMESFAHARFFLMYGQTEATARLSYLPPERLTDKLGSIGKGLPSTRLEVLHPDGRPVRWGSDEIGEIVASGDNITKGYWADETETAKFFHDGKLYTGDLARVDRDGFIFVQDRARDFIKIGGKRVGTKEVEEVICELQEVIEAAIIGAPHETTGEMMKAYLVTRNNTTLRPADVARHIAGRLEAYKVPQSIEFIDQLPKNSAGKVLKPALGKNQHATTEER